MKLIWFIFIPFLLSAQLSVSWNEVVDTESEHDDAIPGTNHPHFTRQWLTADSWNGSEGYYRWLIAYTEEEDDDGYAFDHPNTGSNAVYISWIGRVGSTWWANHTSGDRFKWVMFYRVEQTNPRPTIFNAPVFSGVPTYTYRSIGADVAAGGSGIDEFGEGNFSLNYPNHTYQENASGHSQWYFYICGLVGDYTYVWIYSQDGVNDGGAQGNSYYSRSNQSSWSETWDYVRLLAYIEATTEGDENSYMDICHIMLSQTKPSVPAGFLDEPSAPQSITIGSGTINSGSGVIK